MDIIRKQTVKRSDPEKHPGGTPLAKSPQMDLGTEIIPKDRYTSEEFMELEWEKIWTKTWLLGCREDQIPDPGDFICTNIGRESVLIVRQKNNEIKAGVAFDGWFFGLLDKDAKTNTKKPFLHLFHLELN